MGRRFVEVYNPVRNNLRARWREMKRRCEDPKNSAYARYGGRGIAVCQEWQDFEVFYRWALTNGFETGLTLDRIDNDKGYSPGNCAWRSAKEQNNNTSRNLLVTAFGETKTLSSWLNDERCKVKLYQTLHDRVFKHGWSTEEAITCPVMSNSEAGKLGAAGRWGVSPP